MFLLRGISIHKGMALRGRHQTVPHQQSRQTADSLGPDTGLPGAQEIQHSHCQALFCEEAHRDSPTALYFTGIYTDMKHNSSIDADANERKELLRISEREEFTEEADEPCKMTRNGSEHSSEMRNKKSSTEERRTNNLLEISPSKTSAENQKRNKSSKKRKTSNSLSRHPMNILNELYANL
jgi:hypothetical protein